MSSLFEDFFESQSPTIYAKMLINTSPHENKKFVARIKDRISDSKHRIKEMSEAEKKYKNTNETLKIIEKILDFNKDAQKFFQHASKVDKIRKSEPKTEESIAEKVKLKNEKIAEIKKEEKNVNYLLFKYYFSNIKIQVICIKNYARQKVKKMQIKYIQSNKY